MRILPSRKKPARAVRLWACLGLLTLALLWPAAASHATFRPSDVAGLDRLHESLRRWDAAEARRLGEELLRQQPQDAQLLSALSWAAFYAGEYDKALDLAEKARSISPNPETQGQTAFVRDTVATVSPLARVQSPHFVVRFKDPEDRVLSLYATEALEKIYERMAREFGFAPREPVRVEIFPDTTSFQKASTLSRKDIEVSGAVGIAKFNKIMVISPRTLLRGYRWLDALVHEYLHVLIVKLSGNYAPIWLHEGLAKYQEARWRSEPSLYLNPLNETLLARALRSGAFVSFSDMEPSLVNLDTSEKIQLSYAEGASAIDYLATRGGPGILRKLLSDIESLGEGGTRKAIENILETPFADFEAAWKSFLRAKGLKEIEGVGLPNYTVREGGVVDTEAQELKQIRSLVARNHVRLGDMFVSRGQNPVAVLEYFRGLSKDPYSPYLLNKLATALIRADRGQESISYLEQILRTNPDYAPAYSHLGELYRQSGKLREARDAFEQVIQINPYDPRVHTRLAELYNGLGNPSRSKQEQEIADLLSSAHPGR
ncbi:MAG: tetratricopeptide repeat protein [Candidatus Tectomicrobia bacterium]|uniref:Tetratricopeptide repeat protein n=1 Tax=Tectimicrobiota bacterium TaxID=2528274 RepID=A0A932GP96_UNCTE|nr:tetratricopeptide repeat protein [Candidatus Tectomicrobia bacterium]